MNNTNLKALPYYFFINNEMVKARHSIFVHDIDVIKDGDIKHVENVKRSFDVLITYVNGVLAAVEC